MKVTGLFQMQIQQKQLKFDVQIDIDQSVKYLGEWERYQQIIVNFMQNAVKFTTQGEISVYLSIETADTGQSVNIDRSKFHDKCGKCGFLVTKIIDSGIGMNEQTKQSLFQLFKNFSASENGMIGSSGIGLGLSMSYDLIKQINGIVAVESILEHGTEVSFKINVQNEYCKMNHQFAGGDHKTTSFVLRNAFNDCTSQSNQKQQITKISSVNSIKKNGKQLISDSTIRSYRIPFQNPTIPSNINITNLNSVILMTPNLRQINTKRTFFGDDLNFNNFQQYGEDQILNKSLHTLKQSSLSVLAQGKMETQISNIDNEKLKINNFERYFKKEIRKIVSPNKPQPIFNINFNVQSSNSIKSTPFERGWANNQHQNVVKNEDLEMGDISSSNLIQRRKLSKRQKPKSKLSLNRKKLSFQQQNEDDPNNSSRLNLLVNQKSCARLIGRDRLIQRYSENISDLQSFKNSPFKKSNKVFFNGSSLEKSDISNYQSETFETQLNQDNLNNRNKLPNAYAFEIKNSLIKIKEDDRQQFNKALVLQSKISSPKQQTLQINYEKDQIKNQQQRLFFRNETFQPENLQHSNQSKFNNQDLVSHSERDNDQNLQIEEIKIQIIGQDQQKNTALNPNQTSTFLNNPDLNSEQILASFPINIEENSLDSIKFKLNSKMTLGIQHNDNHIHQFKGMFNMISQQQDNSQLNDLLHPQSFQNQDIKRSNKKQISMMNIQQIQQQSQDFNDLGELQLDQHTGKFQTNLVKKLTNSFQEQDFDDSEIVSLIESSRSNLQLLEQCDCEAQILIVDDNMFNLIPLELIIENISKLKVVKAYNGLEAVNIFKDRLLKTCCNKKFKLVFMDLNMPIMDGYQATHEILELFNEKYPQSAYPNGDALNIVAITAFVNEENINHCYAVGMKEVLHKPIDEDSLRNIINQYYYFDQ
eukprot:403351738